MSEPHKWNAVLDNYRKRIRTLEAEVARLRENEYAVLHEGLDLMAWVKVAEAIQAELLKVAQQRDRAEGLLVTAQARVRELEEWLRDAEDHLGPVY